MSMRARRDQATTWQLSTLSRFLVSMFGTCFSVALLVLAVLFALVATFDIRHTMEDDMITRKLFLTGFVLVAFLLVELGIIALLVYYRNHKVILTIPQEAPVTFELASTRQQYRLAEFREERLGWIPLIVLLGFRGNERCTVRAVRLFGSRHQILSQLRT